MTEQPTTKFTLDLESALRRASRAKAAAAQQDLPQVLQHLLVLWYYDVIALPSPAPTAPALNDEPLTAMLADSPLASPAEITQFVNTIYQARTANCAPPHKKEGERAY